MRLFTYLNLSFLPFPLSHTSLTLPYPHPYTPYPTTPSYLPPHNFSLPLPLFNMLLVLALTFSILCITFSYLKKISKRNPSNSRTNPELNKFYNLPSNSSPQILYKQLVYAASDFLNFYEDLLKQIDFIDPLYKDRLISDEYYNFLCKEKDDCILEKMILESECELLKKGSKNELFSEAGKIKGKKKNLKVIEDNYFNHKRGHWRMNLRIK